MSTINSAISTSADSVTGGGNQARSAQQTEAATLLTATSTPDASTENNNTADTVNITSRAQKIQKLNEEFFTGDIRAFKISQAFIDRLEQYGLISADDAERLGGLGSSGASAAPANSATVGALSDFIDSYTRTVNNVDPGNAITATLQQAKTVLDNFSTPTENSLRIDIPTLSAQLQNYIDSAGEQLPDSDRQSLGQLVFALGIANVLTPGTNSQADINSYLAIAKL